MWSDILKVGFCLIMSSDPRCKNKPAPKPKPKPKPKPLKCEQYHSSPTDCPISIPKTNEPKHCKNERVKSLKINQQFYKLTKPGGKRRIKFPFPNIPFLNQTIATVSLHTALDPVDSRWLSQVSAFRQVTKKMEGFLLQKLPNSTFTNAKDYIKAYLMHDGFIKKVHAPHKFWNPSMDSTFTDIIKTGRFATDSDNIFVQQRLAGPCPFLLKLVTKDGKVGFKWANLLKHLNWKPFERAIQKALNEVGMTLNRAVAKQRLYALYHPETNGMQASPDFYIDRQNYKLTKLTSPITLFARTKSGKLVVVAIQMDYKPTSKVLTPHSNPLEWILAKDMVNMQDINVCNSIWHLSHVHLSGGVFCTLFRSHFSSLHPIHQIMLHHCEGTTPHIAITYGVLAAPNMIGHKIYGISNKGFMALTLKGVPQFNYDTLAYDHLMKRHGLDNKKLKYYPFRDDGGVIWREFEGFAISFVAKYYPEDSNVHSDKELQSFAQQVSINGKGQSYGGKGNIIGFPTEFKTRKALETFITRFLWQIAMHGSINYPLEPWGSFLPLNPTKMYDVKSLTQKTLYTALSDKLTTVGTIGFYTLLGNMRINRVFDYHGDIKDSELSGLVKEFHARMHTCVQDLLAKRNAKRKKNNQMGFQYLEPKWLTNSIHV